MLMMYFIVKRICWAIILLEFSMKNEKIKFGKANVWLGVERMYGRIAHLIAYRTEITFLQIAYVSMSVYNLHTNIIFYPDGN